MSAKWVRVKKWDDQHLTGALLPLKWLLRTFSSIATAVVLLSLVSLYGILASVPIGIVVLAPTFLIYGLTLLAVIAAVALLPAWALNRALRTSSRAARFVLPFIALCVLVVVAAWLWYAFAWPSLKYDHAQGTGFRLFADFIERTKSIQVRRLPGMEMSELEFYAWWPLRIVLILFVINMVVATLRRIEFSFPNIGVLTVHSGIVTIALGSVYYAQLKEEGDTLLLAGMPAAPGTPSSPGPIERGFYDREQSALWISMSGSASSSAPAGAWEQRPLDHIPRYNDYGLDALGLGTSHPFPTSSDNGRSLSIPVPDSSGPVPGFGVLVDPEFSFEIVGYASYCELLDVWIPAPRDSHPHNHAGMEMRILKAFLQEEGDSEDSKGSQKQSYRLLPDVPAQRIAIEGRDVTPGGLLGVEYTRGMPAERWQLLNETLPAGTEHALRITHPASGFKSVFDVTKGSRIEVGGSGYVVEVEDLLPQPQLQIITKGFEGATSSLAIVRVTPPDPKPLVMIEDRGEATPQPSKAKGFQRYVYHRFPEINQDLSDEVNESGMPRRSAPSTEIQIEYIDASIVQVYVDELQAVGELKAGDDPGARVLVRLPQSSRPVIYEHVKGGEAFEVLPRFRMELGERILSARQARLPRIVPDADRDRRAIGSHERAAIAVRVSWRGEGTLKGYSETVWVPFTQYLGVAAGEVRTVMLPDGRAMNLAFGRVRHELRGLALQLLDFEMFPYPHSDVPKDFKSELRVFSRVRTDSGDEDLVDRGIRPTSLNYPLQVRVPFQPNPGAPGWANAAMRAMSTILPMQYKFSQAGWDQQGWVESKQLVASGQLAKPMARFTILGVGNNPGIYVIAAGAVMMSVGIPWAFYLKPVITRRRKKQLQEQLAKEGRLPVKTAGEAGHVNGTSSQAKTQTEKTHV